MGFLRWLGGIVVFFWLMGFLFKVGGGLIHILLIVAAIVFIIDLLMGRRNRT
jgi:predicted membrane metal-binding protein